MLRLQVFPCGVGMRVLALQGKHVVPILEARSKKDASSPALLGVVLA